MTNLPDNEGFGGTGRREHPVILLRPHDLVVRVHQGLLPVAQIAHDARHGKEHCKELRGETKCPVDQPCRLHASFLVRGEYLGYVSVHPKSDFV